MSRKAFLTLRGVPDGVECGKELLEPQKPDFERSKMAFQSVE